MKLLEQWRNVIRDVVRPTLYDPHDRLRSAGELALGLLSLPFELRDYWARSQGSSLAAACAAEPAPNAVVDPPGYLYALEVEALREGCPLRVEIGGHELALYRVGDAFYASDDACPHARGPLSEGEQEGDCVICPLHGWAFDLRSGQCTNIECARLRTYPCRRQGDALYVALDGGQDDGEQLSE